MELWILLKIILEFFLFGFMAWWGSGLDNFIFLIIILKNKNVKQQWWMFFAIMLAVLLVLISAEGLIKIGNFVFSNFPIYKLIGLLLIGIGLGDLRGLFLKKRLNKRNRIEKRRRNIKLFMVVLLFFLINSLDNLVVTMAVFSANQEWIKIVFYSNGFILGAILSFWLALKFDYIIQKIKWLQFLAPTVLIIIGVLIFFNVP